jgi:hypothetical protein
MRSWTGQPQTRESGWLPMNTAGRLDVAALARLSPNGPGGMRNRSGHLPRRRCHCWASCHTILSGWLTLPRLHGVVAVAISLDLDLPTTLGVECDRLQHRLPALVPRSLDLHRHARADRQTLEPDMGREG